MATTSLNIPIEIPNSASLNLEENKKNCPSRMLAGQRGGEEQFRREIEKCFKHRWFFYEILSETQIKAINSIMDSEINNNYNVNTSGPQRR